MRRIGNEIKRLMVINVMMMRKIELLNMLGVIYRHRGKFYYYADGLWL